MEKCEQPMSSGVLQFLDGVSKDDLHLVEESIEMDEQIIRSRSRKGQSALNLATAQGLYKTSVFLLNNGADVSFSPIQSCQTPVCQTTLLLYIAAV